jgi:hypothetical protein
MPEPRKLFSILEITSQLFNLKQINGILFDGYLYQFDFNEYTRRIQNAERDVNDSRIKLHDGTISFEDFTNIQKIYSDEMNKYLIIDENNVICGNYFLNTRHYELHYKRIIIFDKCYYYDKDNCVYTMDEVYVGYLTYDMQFIDEDLNYRYCQEETLLYDDDFDY